MKAESFVSCMTTAAISGLVNFLFDSEGKKKDILNIKLSSKAFSVSL